MVDAENLARYTTLGIYMAPVVFTLPFWLWILSGFVPQLGFLNINLQVWYVTVSLAYLAAMWVVEIFWSSMDVMLNKGGSAKNVTFAAIIFLIMAVITASFAFFVFIQAYTFNNVIYNALIAGLETLGIGLFIWQSKSVISESAERTNHLFAIGSNG